MTDSTTHHFIIEPLKGVGPIQFGMHKDEVSQVFTYIYASFFKGPNSKVRADDCEVIGLIIHYNDACLVNYIEIYKARYAAVTLELFGQDITGISVRGLVELLGSRKVLAERTDYGFDFPELALNTFNSDLSSDDDLVECLGVGLLEENDQDA